MMRDNLRRFILFTIVVIFILNLSACATLKKKFIRKPKKGKKITPVLITQDYRGIYTNEVLYNNHYIYWRGWTEELMESLYSGFSNKRQVQSANLAIEDMERMRDLLNSPKKEALLPHIKIYEDILAKLKRGQPNRVDAIRMRSTLEKERRIIIREFETRKVKEFIIKEEEPIKPITTVEQSLIK